MRPVALSIKSPVECNETWTTLVPASNEVNTNPSDSAARRNGAKMKGLRPEEFVHPTIGAVGRDQFERNQQQQRQKQPADQTECGEPFDDGKMVRRRGFQRRVIIRVDSDQQQAQQPIGAIDDPQVDGLDAAPGERNAK